LFGGTHTLNSTLRIDVNLAPVVLSHAFRRNGELCGAYEGYEFDVGCDMPFSLKSVCNDVDSDYIPFNKAVYADETASVCCLTSPVRNPGRYCLRSNHTSCYGVYETERIESDRYVNVTISVNGIVVSQSLSHTFNHSDSGFSNITAVCLAVLILFSPSLITLTMVSLFLKITVSEEIQVLRMDDEHVLLVPTERETQSTIPLTSTFYMKRNRLDYIIDTPIRYQQAVSLCRMRRHALTATPGTESHASDQFYPYRSQRLGDASYAATENVDVLDNEFNDSAQVSLVETQGLKRYD
jgi:hypothetical protein